jgi:hypothetical protein
MSKPSVRFKTRARTAHPADASFVRHRRGKNLI